MSFPDADAIADQIGDGLIRPTIHSVVRAMHRHMILKDELQEAVLSAFDSGTQIDVEREIWHRVDQLEPEAQSGLRLSIGLIRPDAAIDGELAEYLVLWARNEGLSDKQIVDAFLTA